MIDPLDINDPEHLHFIQGKQRVRALQDKKRQAYRHGESDGVVRAQWGIVPVTYIPYMFDKFLYREWQRGYRFGLRIGFERTP